VSTGRGSNRSWKTCLELLDDVVVAVLLESMVILHAQLLGLYIPWLTAIFRTCYWTGTRAQEKESGSRPEYVVEVLRPAGLSGCYWTLFEHFPGAHPSPWLSMTVWEYGGFNHDSCSPPMEQSGRE